MEVLGENTQSEVDICWFKHIYSMMMSIFQNQSFIRGKSWQGGKGYQGLLLYNFFCP
jgi:hypothetical protein